MFFNAIGLYHSCMAGKFMHAGGKLGYGGQHLIDLINSKFRLQIWSNEYSKSNTVKPNKLSLIQ